MKEENSLLKSFTPEEKKLYEKNVKIIIDKVSKKINKKCLDTDRIVVIKVIVDEDKQIGEDVMVFVPKKGPAIAISLLFLVNIMGELFGIGKREIEKIKNIDRSMVV